MSSPQARNAERRSSSFTIQHGVSSSSSSGSTHTTSITPIQNPTQPPMPPELINNSTLKYTPITLPSSKVTLQCSNLSQIQSLHPQIFSILDSDLTQCLALLPPNLTPLIHRTQIWLNLSYSYGLLANPRKVIHTTAHHTLEFLQWIKDNPQKVYGIEIYSIEFYLANRRHWNGCGLILHELCHLIHQFVFGLEYEGIKMLWGSVKGSGMYDCVLRRDWAGLEQDYDMAYALINHKEFFAEMSVTYLANSYTELDPCVGAGDNERRNSMEDCCPPITSEKVLERLQQKVSNQNGQSDKSNIKETNDSATKQSTSTATSKISIREKDEEEEDTTKSCLKKILCPSSNQQKNTTLKQHEQPIPHCNKFYPFTAGQLKYYDIQLYQSMEQLWNAVSEWKDPYVTKPCWGCKSGMETKKNDVIVMKEENDEDMKNEEMVVVDTVEL